MNDTLKLVSFLGSFLDRLEHFEDRCFGVPENLLEEVFRIATLVQGRAERIVQPNSFRFFQVEEISQATFVSGKC